MPNLPLSQSKSVSQLSQSLTVNLFNKPSCFPQSPSHRPRFH